MPPPPQQGMPAPGPPRDVRDVKVSQAEAAYGPAYQPDQSCGTCIHFDGAGSCEIVEGPIEPQMVSDFFEPAAPVMGGGA